MNKIIKLVLAATFILPSPSLAENEDCLEYLKELDKYDFIEYLQDGEKLNYTIRMKNGLTKEATGLCENYDPSQDSTDFIEYYKDFDVALFRLTNRKKEEPMNTSYLLVNIRNGQEHEVKSMTSPILSPDGKRLVTDFSKKLQIFNLEGNNIKLEYEAGDINDQLNEGDEAYTLSIIRYLDEKNKAQQKYSPAWVENNKIQFQKFVIGKDVPDNYKVDSLELTKNGWRLSSDIQREKELEEELKKLQ